jgi:serine O-acetyltransferase
MHHPFIERLYLAHRYAQSIPAPSVVFNWLDGMLSLLFPELSNQRYQNIRNFQQAYLDIQLQLNAMLETIRDTLNDKPETIEEQFTARLPFVYEMLLKDAEAIFHGDPAAASQTEVIRTYPGFYAIAVYRLAHEFFQLEVPLIPRILTEHAHSITGIDIHPGARIGERFCIDHGTGVVIGETVNIGDEVKLYQGVTLGALSVRKELAQTKRHPTIEDRVVIYSGATILGGDTVVGHDAIIGGNVWLTTSVPPFSKVYYTENT